MDSSKAIKNLFDIQEISEGKVFLAYGSCLGAVRDQDIIKHDPDTDVGILSEDFTYDLIKKLQNAGFSIMHQFGRLDFGLEISVARYGIKTDIWLFYLREDGSRWNGLWDNGGRNGDSDIIIHTYPKGMIENREVVNLLGINFIGLGLDYIKHVYGDDWKTPIKEWNWKTDHKCIEK